MPKKYNYSVQVYYGKDFEPLESVMLEEYEIKDTTKVIETVSRKSYQTARAKIWTKILKIKKHETHQKTKETI